MIFLVALAVPALHLWLWWFLNAMNELHHPGVGFRYDWRLRQYIRRSNGEREYLISSQK